MKKNEGVIMDLDVVLPAEGQKPTVYASFLLKLQARQDFFSRNLGYSSWLQGKVLNMARKKCKRGEWGPFVGFLDVGGKAMTLETAQKLRKIASHVVESQAKIKSYNDMLKMVYPSKDFKIHVAGEFFDTTYIDAWSEVVRECSDVSFFTYTRAWRRSAFVSALQRLAGNANIQRWLSCGQSTGEPPTIPGTRVAYLATHDADIPAFGCDLAFRSTLERLTLLLPMLGSTPVCPHQNGKPNSPPDCVTCRICLPSAGTARPRRIA